MIKKTLSLLSICQKAGRLSSGEFACEKSLQKGLSYLIIIAEDAADNTKKKFTNKCYFYNVPVAIFQPKDELSRTIGKVNRSVLSINDFGFANKIKEYLQNNILNLDNNGENN